MSIVGLRHYTRDYIKAHPHAWFVFGDNLARLGRGGQAYACRDEPNIIGIPTKRYPSHRPGSFFSDRDFYEVLPHLQEAFMAIHFHLGQQKTIYIPSDGVGTGLAHLPTTAPSIYQWILTSMRSTMDIYGSSGDLGVWV